LRKALAGLNSQKMGHALMQLKTIEPRPLFWTVMALGEEDFAFMTQKHCVKQAWALRHWTITDMTLATIELSATVKAVEDAVEDPLGACIL
jgi:hypothetical protein